MDSARLISDFANLSGKVAIVTGGNRGIGAAISYKLAQAGADILMPHKTDKTPDSLIESIKAAGRRVLLAPKVDVSSQDNVRTMVRQAMKEFGRIDILVNNAGIYPHSPPTNTSEEEWDRVVDVNLKGAFLCSREVAKAMIENGRGGKIVNIASIDAFRPEPDFSHYDASKAGLVGLTRSLALSWGRFKINVNAVAPGLVDTEGLFGNAPKRAEAFVKCAALGQVPAAGDVANAVLFLASRASDMITGQTICVDGGVLLCGYMSFDQLNVK